MERVSVRLVATLAVLALMILAASGQSDCKGKVGKYEYDLTPLAQKLGAVDLQTQDGGNPPQTYYYRVCGVVSNNFCQTVDDMTPAVCQKDTRIPAEFHDCGNQKTARFQKLPSGSDSDGFTLSYTGGQDGRASMIYFKCDKSKDPGVFSFVKEDPVKTYDLQYLSKWACPTNGGGGGGGGGGDDDDGGISGGWIFIIILSSLLVLYLVGGVAFNKFYRHHEGKEIIPNVEFWLALPGLVKDGHLFVWRKARSLTGRGSYEEM
jgi:hypothetical protein